MISSESNGQIKEVIKLQKQARYRRKQQTFVVEGIKMVQEAAYHGKLQKMYISEGKYQEISQILSALVNTYEYEIVSDQVLKQISETVTPQGILGTVTLPTYDMENILQQEKHRFLLLDDLRDPGNLGTVMRTAEGAGMSGVLLSKGSVDLFNPKVVRSTMGAIFRVPYCYVEDLAEVARQIRNMGYEVYGTAMEGSVAYDEPDYTAGAAVVIGNEANGISETVFQSVTKRIRIPMEGQLESLNAAISAAIVMYEMQRQERRNLTK
ncbi:MAG: RNA methyltransferase [Eubacteriales bacterium]|nr:RNA methyltransferase [Eubacteriales bacterium]